MARAVSITQADGNQIRGAMIKFDMDGNLTVPTTWNVGATIATSDEAGNAIDASTAESIQTSGATANAQVMQDLCDELNSVLTGANAVWAQNTADEYIVEITCIPGQAWNVDVSTAVFEVDGG